jgi:hypothetical protein
MFLATPGLTTLISRSATEEEAERPKEPEEDILFSRVVSTAVMGLGVVAQGEEIGAHMATRMTNHLIQLVV